MGKKNNKSSFYPQITISISWHVRPVVRTMYIHHDHRRLHLSCAWRQQMSGLLISHLGSPSFLWLPRRPFPALPPPQRKWSRTSNSMKSVDAINLKQYNQRRGLGSHIYYVSRFQTPSSSSQVQSNNIYISFPINADAVIAPIGFRLISKSHMVRNCFHTNTYCSTAYYLMHRTESNNEN